MLDDFSLEQPIIYKTLINSLKNDKISHAYLFEANGYPKVLEFSLAFAKSLLCPKKYTNFSNCQNCEQCKNINNGEFLELKIINPDGQWIKKSQLDELQSEFSKKSIIGTRKVYIINGADKLNQASSNSLLKFLEEPEEGIIAILIVDDIYQLLDTIISRCQVLSLKNKKEIKNLSTEEKIIYELKNKDLFIEDFLENDEEKNNLDKILNFIKYYEDNHEQTIIYLPKLWHTYFKEKNEIYIAFSILILFYKDVINFLASKEIKIFNNYQSEIQYVALKNSLDKIVSKLNIIIDLREKIKFNANNNLLMDKLIIELEGCE